MLIAYDDAVVREFPTIRGGIVHATGLANGPSPPALREAYRAEQRLAAERLEHVAIAELPPIAAWRRVFPRFGVKPTQHRAAPEALLRRLARSGEIPPINALVDAGNLVSVRYALPVAVFDLAGVAAPVQVRFATGDEPFTDLGSDEAGAPEPGEVVFADRDGVVAARRWCWRQSRQSATGPATTEALFVVEGHHEGADADVGAALADLIGLLRAHQPGCRVSAHRLPSRAAREARA
jgi:DNA/RNA-binding domain of Phe-tRNA-synthetase-like protein